MAKASKSNGDAVNLATLKKQLTAVEKELTLTKKEADKQVKQLARELKLQLKDIEASALSAGKAAMIAEIEKREQAEAAYIEKAIAKAKKEFDKLYKAKLKKKQTVKKASRKKAVTKKAQVTATKKVTTPVVGDMPEVIREVVEQATDFTYKGQPEALDTKDFEVISPTTQPLVEVDSLVLETEED